jgi:hypothetical protein
MPSFSLSRSNGSGSQVVRVARALRMGVGHVVVTARDIEQAEDTVDAALASVDSYKVLRLSATNGSKSTTGKPCEPNTSSIASVSSEARESGRRVFVVISDADLASVEQLESLRVRVEGAPGSSENVRMVLIGSPVLSRILQLPSARGLASRVGMQAAL